MGGHILLQLLFVLDTKGSSCCKASISIVGNAGSLVSAEVRHSHTHHYINDELCAQGMTDPVIVKVTAFRAQLSEVEYTYVNTLPKLLLWAIDHPLKAKPRKVYEAAFSHRGT